MSKTIRSDVKEASILYEQAEKAMYDELLKERKYVTLEEASSIGYTYNVPIKVGDWELIFSPAREAGKLPVIKHAVYMP